LKIEDVPPWMIEVYQPLLIRTLVDGKFTETEKDKEHNDRERETWEAFKKSIGGEG
jgi:hypothetical protein